MKNWQAAKWEDALVGLGSNVGDRLENLSMAARYLGNLTGIKISGVSRVWRSAPAGYRAQRWFYNAVMKIRTSHSIPALVRRLKAAERALGRKRRFQNGPREIDVDLLLLGSRVMHTAAATVPHPRMHLRRFVLAPAAEVAPGMVHPENGKSVRSLLRGLGRGGSAIALKREEQLRFRAGISGMGV